jgi:uncharacterized membrane protein YqiK
LSLALLELLVVVGLPALLLLALLGRRITPPPGYALLVHGRRTPDGLGHAVVRNTTLILPLVESAELVPLAAFPVSIARSGLLLHASVRLPDDPARLLEALQLLGGRSPAALEELAGDALRGTLEHVIAGQEPGVARDPERVRRQLQAEAEAALRELGFELETLSLSLSPE